jgi:hypothetical protein
MSSDRELQARRRQAIIEILGGDEQVSEQKEDGGENEVVERRIVT